MVWFSESSKMQRCIRLVNGFCYIKMTVYVGAVNIMFLDFTVSFSLLATFLSASHNFKWAGFLSSFFPEYPKLHLAWQVLLTKWQKINSNKFIVSVFTHQEINKRLTVQVTAAARTDSSQKQLKWKFYSFSLNTTYWFHHHFISMNIV